uniref:Uncharacterized protein n=1 Tax=Cacopsylla melanoneura TaxID=428564 RepID=A0A8D9E3X6_9HEMI
MIHIFKHILFKPVKKVLPTHPIQTGYLFKKVLQTHPCPVHPRSSRIYSDSPWPTYPFSKWGARNTCPRATSCTAWRRVVRSARDTCGVVSLLAGLARWSGPGPDETGT